MADPNLPGQPQQGQPPAYGQPADPAYGQPQGQPGYAAQQQTTVVAAPQPMMMTTVITKTQPSSHLGLAIFSMLCCFLPTGIVAVVFAAMVDGAWQNGEEDKAHNYSKNAKCWSIASIVLGIVSIVLVIVIVVVYFVVIVASVASAVGDGLSDLGNIDWTAGATTASPL